MALHEQGHVKTARNPKIVMLVVVIIATYKNKQCFYEDYMIKSPTCSHQNPAIPPSNRIKLTVSRKIPKSLLAGFKFHH